MTDEDAGRCPYCDEKSGCYIEFERWHRLSVEGNSLVFGASVELMGSSFSEEARVFVNYCPMCGRRLSPVDDREV